MGATALALLFLALGFVVVSRWTMTRAMAQRAAENPQYFNAALAGAVVFLLAHALVDTAERFGPFGALVLAHIRASGAAVVGGDIADATIARAVQLFLAGIVISFALPAVLNHPLRRAALLLAVVERGGARTNLERMAGESMEQNLPLMLTQDTGKVVVGFIVGEDARSMSLGEWIRVQPVLSGYRDEQQRFAWTTSYEWLHEPDDVVLRWLDRDARAFDFVLPVTSIKSIHAFDMAMYAAIYAGSDGTHAASVARAAIAARASDASPVRKGIREHRGAFRLYGVYCVIVVAVLPLASIAGSWTGIASAVLAAALAWYLRSGEAGPRPLRTN